jgi:hypothetical protein
MHKVKMFYRQWFCFVNTTYLGGHSSSFYIGGTFTHWSSLLVVLFFKMLWLANGWTKFKVAIILNIKIQKYYEFLKFIF